MDYDALTAEHIMGWYKAPGLTPWFSKEKTEGFVANGGWSPTTSASDDNEVLNHVTKQWNEARIGLFSDALMELWDSYPPPEPVKRIGFLHLRYRVGDYCKAALIALNLATMEEFE